MVNIEKMLLKVVYDTLSVMCERVSRSELSRLFLFIKTCIPILFNFAHDEHTLLKCLAHTKQCFSALRCLPIFPPSRRPARFICET